MSIFRVEHTTGFTVMSNYHLRDKNLSLKAKGLLSQMLSLPEEWDYTLAGLSFINREKIDAVREAIKELESAGYIVRNRERDEKGRLKGTEYVIYEQPQQENPEVDNPASENPTLDYPTLEKPTLENPMQLNTYKRNKEKSITDSINHPSIRDGADEMSRSDLEDEIKSNIDYDIIIENKQNDKRQIDEIVTLMLDAISSPSPTVRINGTDISKSAVRERFLQLDSEHIEYVIFAMERSKPEIRNIRAYLLTALYNAPATMDSYYSALVSRDLNL